MTCPARGALLERQKSRDGLKAVTCIIRLTHDTPHRNRGPRASGHFALAKNRCAIRTPRAQRLQSTPVGSNLPPLVDRSLSPLSLCGARACPVRARRINLCVCSAYGSPMPHQDPADEAAFVTAI
eukprot:7382071-Prymnesium_polylepis.1